MEIVHQHAVHESDDHDSGTWAVVTHGNNIFLGKLHSLLEGSSEARVRRLIEKGKDVGVDEVLSAYASTFMPVYDVFIPILPAPGGGGVHRSSLIFGHSITYRPHPVHIIHGAGVCFDFLSQMNQKDAKRWAALRADAHKTVTESAKADDARQSGIVLPGSGDMARHRG